MLWLSLLIVLLVILLTRRWKMRRIIELSKRLNPGIKSYPFIGMAYLFIGNGIDRMNGLILVGRRALTNGGMTSMWFGPNLYVVAANPIDLKVIMKVALNKGNEMRFIRNVTRNGTIFAPVNIWRPRRKVIAPIFSPKNLNEFVEIFARQSSITVEQMSPVVGKGVVSLWKYITTYTLDAICESTMNLQLNSQQQNNVPFLEAFSKGCDMVAMRLVQPWLYSDTLYKLLQYQKTFLNFKSILDNFITDAIKKCRKNMMESQGDTKHVVKNLVQLMIESSGGKSGFTDLELHEETMVLVFAGNDTSAVGACFVLSMLARYPDVQEKVAKELQEVFGDSNRPIVADDLPHLKYLEAVIKETLRLYPPVPIITRQIEKDIELPSGITLASGCTVLVHIWAVHRNQNYWGEDAEQFRPERFIEAPLKDPGAFMPFSTGSRNCIGNLYAMMSMKSILSTILRSYRVTCDDDTTIGQPIKVSFEIMMKDSDGYKVRLEKRKINAVSEVSNFTVTT